jgi:hypothetical protein
MNVHHGPDGDIKKFGQNEYAAPSSPVKSFHESFSIGSPSRVRARGGLPPFQSPNNKNNNTQKQKQRTIKLSPGPIHLSPATTAGDGGGSLSSLKSASLSSLKMSHGDDDDDHGDDYNGDVNSNNSFANKNNDSKSSVNFTPLSALKQAQSTSPSAPPPPSSEAQSSPSREKQTVFPPPLLDESFVSYVEEVVTDDDDEDGVGFATSSEDYEYIEEIILDEINEQTNGDNGRITKVRFDEFDEVQNTIHLTDFTDKEISKYWYHRDDYDGMIQEARIVVEKEERVRQNGLEQLQPGIISQSLTEFETRGLEAWSTEGKRHVREVKEAAIEAVWDEQQRQWDVGIIDLDQMKDAYQKVSLECQRIANERGVSDQIIVERIRQLDELGAGIDSGSPQRRLKKTRPNGLVAKSRSIFGIHTDASSASSRKLLLQSISRTASRRASERNQRIIYKQPSASARALIDAASLSIDNRDDGKTSARREPLSTTVLK